MENDKSTINEELDHIRNSINQKNETQNDDDNFILLDKIISKFNFSNVCFVTPFTDASVPTGINTGVSIFP